MPRHRRALFVHEMLVQERPRLRGHGGHVALAAGQGGSCKGERAHQRQHPRALGHHVNAATRALGQRGGAPGIGVAREALERFLAHPRVKTGAAHFGWTRDFYIL